MFRFNIKKLSWSQLIFINLISSLLLWTKNEGVFFFLIVLSYLLYYQNSKKRIVLIFFSFSLIFLKIYLISQNSSLDHNIFNSNIKIFNTFFFEKIAFISLHILIAFFKYPIWIILILILFFKNIDYKYQYYIFFYYSILNFFNLHTTRL